MACSNTSAKVTNSVKHTEYPAQVFDLNQWKITLPLDKNNDGKVDEIKVKDMQTFAHPNYFYLDAQNHMVFASPNVAITTANSKNTRSELRHMLRGANTNIKTKSPKNNFAVSAHPKANEFGLIGGKMEATLKVEQVSTSGNPEKYPSYSVVVGQIHAGKDSAPANGLGYGNEPLKIYYKKFPGHQTGSVFWNYERNLPKDDPNRMDIAYPVWGNTWENSADPVKQGIALGESFSYSVNVYQNTMHLTFTADGHKTIKYSVNLADNVDPYGKVDTKDFAKGYAGDWHYFKAGAYNQCNAGTTHPFWGTGCGGTGDWSTDVKNGDYTKVSFSKLTVSQGEAP
ncbi:polysaccharide lyase family 7 protein [Paraglaciecola aquimarina]|uniref:Polysaccharide lyase family 7 protein n=2 Tax=Paraglaciecola algarum TaxID=3050085 RepID=A0ABS9D1Q1_9ALTE|nr:polysaccharide lyase family 7 protein [Paraglaciecola sp. G1-23]MCF2946848.1 polysaccharide lyase family 7 protein [Paraglaciecola sp. G1-23]